MWHSGRGKVIVGLLLVLALCTSARAGEPSAGRRVQLVGTPHGGIQPQAAVDLDGTLHLLYFTGEPSGGDLFYVQRGPASDDFSAPVRVNHHPASAVAKGTIRGGQIAVGRDGRVHIVWNGTKESVPSGPDGQLPLLYTRSETGHQQFEEERNVIQRAYGLDGGGSVAADSSGNVYVTWHAGPLGLGEEHRRVWVARSQDDGRTFAAERPLWDEPTGACGCCGMRAWADPSRGLYVLYRGARAGTHRDMYLVSTAGDLEDARGSAVGRWQIAACPMSSAWFSQLPSGQLIAAWETAGQVYFAPVGPDGTQQKPIAAPGPPTGRKHPVVVGNGGGELLLVWVEGTGWQRGGRLAWQLYDSQLQPVGQPNKGPDVPVWSLAAAAAVDDGFWIIH